MPLLISLAMSQFAFSCEPGWEDRLIGELLRVFPQSDHAQVAEGWVVSQQSGEEPVGTPCVALCTQCLPRVEAIAAESISAWGQAIGLRLMAGLEDHAGPWRLHVFGVYADGGTVSRKRCELIRENIESLLRKKQRRLLRTQTVGDEPWKDGEALVQVGLATAGSGYFSLCEEPSRIQSRRMMSPFAGGVVEVAADRQEALRLRLRKIGRSRTSIRSEDQRRPDVRRSGQQPPAVGAYVALDRGAAGCRHRPQSSCSSDLMANPAADLSPRRRLRLHAAGNGRLAAVRRDCISATDHRIAASVDRRPLVPAIMRDDQIPRRFGIYFAGAAQSMARRCRRRIHSAAANE